MSFNSQNENIAVNNPENQNLKNYENEIIKEEDLQEEGEEEKDFSVQTEGSYNT